MNIKRNVNCLGHVKNGLGEKIQRQEVRYDVISVVKVRDANG